MKQTNVRCVLLLLVIAAAYSGAQEYNSVPLNHPAYDIIELGVIQGIIFSPPLAKPWSVYTVKQKLREMIHDPAQILSSQEMETVVRVLDSFDRKAGFQPMDGRYRTENGSFSFEAGLGWESIFSVESSAGLLSSVNTATLYVGGDLAHFASWNINVSGDFLYIEREDHAIPSVFPYSFSKQWDGGVLSLRKPGTYASWPDDPALAYGLEGELNGVFFDQRLQLRLGRLRHNWGNGSTSLFLNPQSRPFASFEGTFSPLSWMNISVLGGALERFDEDNRRTNAGQFTDILSAAHIEFNPLMYLHVDIGGAAVWLNEPNLAGFANLELRLPGLLSLWVSLFVDQIDSFSENFFSTNGNNYAYQAGIKTIVHWLPLAAFTFQYTKIEPYCYSEGWTRQDSAFISGGESLGYYLPPNSDELLIRLESRLFPDIKAHVQFQMIRHGADYGYGAVAGSSLYNPAVNATTANRPHKYFLRDGVYQWDNALKLGGSFNLKSGDIPLSLFTEIGLVVTNFTINGSAGPGNEADYDTFSDEIYRGGSRFIFSIGFRLFP